MCQRLPAQIFVCAHRPYSGGASPQDMLLILRVIYKREIMSVKKNDELIKKTDGLTATIAKDRWWRGGGLKKGRFYEKRNPMTV